MARHYKHTEEQKARMRQAVPRAGPALPLCLWTLVSDPDSRPENREPDR